MAERTHDFLQYVQAASSSGGGIIKKKPSADARTGFNDSTSEIAKGIHRTSTLLTKLTTLVKKQGLFDDPTDEINNLIHRIKSDLDELNSKCDSAQSAVDAKKGYFNSVDQSGQHSVKVVSGLKSDLLTTTRDFKSVLELRSNKMKDQQLKKVQLTGRGVLSPTRDLSRNRDEQRVPLPSPYADVEAGGAGQRYIPRNEEVAQQQHLLLEPVATASYYDAREKAVSEVQATIGELGQLFKRLSSMLAEQAELVERIDDDVENAVSETQRGKDALMKAYEAVSSNRGMYMKIGAILAAFILFFVLFVL